jgi:hypothetical protein
MNMQATTNKNSEAAPATTVTPQVNSLIVGKKSH